MIEIDGLIDKVKNGEKEAFAELVMSVHKDLFAYARMKLQNENDVQDVVQNTIIRAYENIEKLNSTEHFRVWINKILANECNRFYYRNKREKIKSDKSIQYYNNYTENPDENIGFDNIIQGLNEKEKLIFKMYFEDEISIRSIAKLLNTKEGTVRSILSRGKRKLRKTIKPYAIMGIILCVFVLTSVVAMSFMGYLKSLFETESSGFANDGVLMAIENMDWYQKVDMDYIDLGNGCKIKADYVLLDEMTFYVVLDFTSEEDISKYNDICFSGLEITNENGEVIFNSDGILQDRVIWGDKTIEHNAHNIKFLGFLYEYSIPKSKTINIGFQKLNVAKMLDLKEITNGYNSFSIDLDEKFIDREFISYSCQSSDIEKAIISKTGFCAVFNAPEGNVVKEVMLFDEAGNEYKCTRMSLGGSFTDGLSRYAVISDCNGVQAERLILKVDDREYELKKNKGGQNAQ